jgi:hypothetical protein
MKRNFVLIAVFALFTLSAAAQEKAKTPDFGGTWNLDVAKSQLGDRNSIESQVMTVTQTATTFKVETSTKRTPPQTVNPGGMPAGSEARKTPNGRRRCRPRDGRRTLRRRRHTVDVRPRR